MSDVRVVIVDDEINNIKVLQKLLTLNCKNVKVVGFADNIKEAEEMINTYHPDVVLLDIEMPGGDGFELLERYDDPDFDVVFTTAHSEYAVRAFKYAAIDYLLKPINASELAQVFEKIEPHDDRETSKKKIEVFKSNRSNDGYDLKKIAMPTDEGMEFIDINDIVRFEADRSYCSVYLNNGKSYMVSKPMKEFEGLLDQKIFFKVHKSNIVNLNYVKKYIRGRGGHVVLQDDSLVNVSVRKKDEFLSLFQSR